jgi:IS605 OrfB family transposase
MELMEQVLTVSCKLAYTPSQKAQLERTLKAFADACNFVAEQGRQHKISQQFALHKLCYKSVREQFGLSANLAVRAIARVAPRLAKKPTRDSEFAPTSVDYDVRIFTFKESDWSVSLTLLDGRARFFPHIGDYQKAMLSGKQPTSAVLCKKRGAFFLDIQVKIESDAPITPTGMLGVDLGVKNIATLSDGTVMSSAALNAYRKQRHQIRRSLQAKTHKQASRRSKQNVRRLLKRLSGKESRTVKLVNHTISKAIVRQAKEAKQAIVFEDLSGIRDRTNQKLRKSERTLHNAWSFYSLQQFVEYKAKLAGIPVVKIDARYTSQTCHQCLHIGQRKGEAFKCANCGLDTHADVNAAQNIATVGAVVTRLEDSEKLSCVLQHTH